MIVFDKLENIKDIPRTSIALGNFDGVHLGHQELIRQAVANARKKTSQGSPEKSAVFTFSNHPKSLIPGAKEVKNIIYREDKEALIESLGVDYYFDIEFTPEIMTMDPERYVKELLVDRFNAKDVFCGFNYRYGYKAAGDGELMRSLGEKYGFTLNQIPPVMVDGEVVSSTLIRQLIKAGDMDDHRLPHIKHHDRRDHGDPSQRSLHHKLHL